MATKDVYVPSELDVAMLALYQWASRKHGRRFSIDVGGGATYATLDGPDGEFEGIGPLATDGSGEVAAIYKALAKAPF